MFRSKDLPGTDDQNKKQKAESRRAALRLGVCAALLLSAVALSRMQGEESAASGGLRAVFGRGTRAEKVFTAVGRGAAGEFGAGAVTEAGGKETKAESGITEAGENWWEAVEAPAGIIVRIFADGE